MSPIFAQPIAAFTSNLTSGCSPLVVSFQNQSTNAVSYEWQTGNGSSLLQNPTVLYTAPGTYPVTLVAIDAQGLRDTLVYQQYITVYANPLAQFSVNQTQACAKVSLNFSDFSQPGSGVLTQWSWDFGDGKSSSLAQPAHAYTKGGSYPVSLTVTNQYGCSHSLLKNAYVDVQELDMAFSASQTVSCGAPLTVTFSPVQTAGLTHAWTFGDGGSAAVASPSHTYQAIGSYDVTHIAEDAQGCRDTLVEASFINIGANTLSAYAADSSLCTGDTAFFTAQAPPGSLVTWDFKDGNTGSGIHPKHLYQAAGSYTVDVTIFDPGGCQVSRSIPMVVHQRPFADFAVADTNVGCSLPFSVDFVNLSTNATSYTWLFFTSTGGVSYLQDPTKIYHEYDSFHVRLVASGTGGCFQTRQKNHYIRIFPMELGFTANETGGCAPFPVTFEDTTKSYYPIVSWHWDFGDGSTGTGPNPQHVYTSTGVYDITLIITNSQGCTDTLFKEEYIEVGSQPSADFVADTLSACALGPINFINLSTNALSYLWLFGDGDTAMSVNPTHGFAAIGPMDVVLIAKNQGCADTLFKPLYIDVLAPLPVIGMTGRYLCDLTETVHFLNLSVGDDTWQWTLPNGSVSLDSVTSYNFTQPGQYPITLKVANLSTGCEAEVTDSVYVWPITAAFSMVPTAGCLPFTAQFQDLSSGANRWEWDFGDGGTSVAQHPSYLFKKGGYFPVKLTVENSYGCKDTHVIDSVRVSLLAPKILTNSPLKGCTPLAVTFQDNSTIQGTSIVSWLWDFGDGNSSTAQHPTHTYTQAGEFTVKLTIEDDLGCSKTHIYNQKVVATNPQPSFTVQPHVACPGVPVTFISSSTGLGISYLWDLGDGSTSTQANPSYAYADTGFMDVSLTVSDIHGCSRTLTQGQAVNVRHLWAEFVGDTLFAPCPPLEVTFNAKNDFPHNGIFYQWDFGNGATGNQSVASHMYTQPGVYDIRLIVGTASGCRDTLIRPGYIAIEGPSASFTFTPGEGCPGTTIDFSAAVVDSVNYQWIYGDGGIGSGPFSSHLYEDPGQYLPVLVIEDFDGCRVFTYARDSVRIFTPPVADLAPASSEFCDQGMVQFQDLSVGSVTSWLWEFSDGQTSQAQHPQISFSGVGSYTASLVVTDVHGCTDTVEISEAVRIHPSPHPMVSTTDTSGCLPLHVSLMGVALTHPSSIQSWTWHHGALTHTGANWDHHLNQVGPQTITLQVVDARGCEGEFTQQFEVFPLPVADFALEDTAFCAPTSLTFNDRSVGVPISWQWQLGNGMSSLDQHPSFSMVEDGTIDVSLWVEDGNGCRDSLTRPAYVQLFRPEAQFTQSDREGCPGTLFQFFDQTQSSRALVSWDWHFGDGDTAGVPSPSHRYAMSGIYDVTMWVTDERGCSDTVTLPQAVLIEELVQPEVIQLQYASVVGDEQVMIEFERYDNRREDFGAYLVFRSENGQDYVVVDTIAQLTQTFYTDQQLDTRARRYWYKVLPSNICGNLADWDSTLAHATVQLSAAPGIDESFLHWTPYQGWSPAAYEIYRVTNYQPNSHVHIATVGGGDSTFTDLDFRCGEDYHYRVIAVGETFSAGSDSSHTEPLHIGPAEPTDMVRATVENNQSILIEWTPAPIEMADRVLVERRNGTNYTLVATLPASASATKVSDPDVEVSQQSYAYRVTTVDSCGDATPLGLTGKTILLQAAREFSGSRLTWSPYQGWRNGVEGYTLEVWEEATQGFRVVAQLSAGVSTYFDEKTNFNQSTYCYRITAWELGGNLATSQSNEACVEPQPMVYAPNAFSPNGDGINDAFRIGVSFIGSANLVIYNRWGKKIFESSSLDVAWTGICSDGAVAPEGVYVFKVEAVGFQGQAVHHTGTVTLLR